MERLVEAVQRRARERSQRFVGRTLDVLVEGTSRTDPSRLRGRSRHNKVVNFDGRGGAGGHGPGADHVGDVADAGRRVVAARDPAMKRLVVLLALLLAPAANAQPQALGRAEAVAVSDGAAIYAHASSRIVTVWRVPFDGSARSLLFTRRVREDEQASFDLAASSERVGVLLTLSARKTGAIRSDQVLAGPPTGPLLAVTGIKDPVGVSAAGDSIVVEDTDDLFTAIAADGARTSFQPAGAFSGVDFAGDLVAYGTDMPSEEDPPTRFVVENWRTGERLRDLELPAGLMHVDLREDGRAIIETDGGPLRELTAGGILRDLPYDGGQPVQAGERIVITRRDSTGIQRLVALAPDGSQRRVGLPSQQIPAFTADAGHVVWESNGCAFASALDDPFARTFSNAGCRASEIDIPAVRTPRLAHRVPVPVRCLNAATGVCTGSLSGTEIEPAAFSVAAGRRRLVRVRVRPRAFRKLRRQKYRVLHLTAPPGFPFLLADGPRR